MDPLPLPSQYWILYVITLNLLNEPAPGHRMVHLPPVIGVDLQKDMSGRVALAEGGVDQLDGLGGHVLFDDEEDRRAGGTCG
jgi:hypothetical protein